MLEEHIHQFIFQTIMAKTIAFGYAMEQQFLKIKAQMGFINLGFI